MPWSRTTLKHWRSSTTRTVRTGARWAWQGLVDVGHNSLAVLGLACIGVVVFFSGDSSLRHQLERHALEWLNLRHGSLTVATEEGSDLLASYSEPEAVARATARQLKGLPRNQALVAAWLARRYRVAPEAVARLVEEAWQVGTKAKVDPTLILAIMAIESGFNPFAQSPVGAQGLMQVMTQVHDDKYTAFGGTLAAFDPVTNLRVGVQVLRECISRAGGDTELGLKFYVGAANLPTDGGYADKVLGEQAALLQVASGVNVQPQVVSVRSSAPMQTVVAAAPLNTGMASDRNPPPAAARSAGATMNSSISSVAPAAHATAGTVMAPALGAALAANLSPPVAQTAPAAPVATPNAAPAASDTAATARAAEPRRPAAAEATATSTNSAASPAAAKPEPRAAATNPAANASATAASQLTSEAPATSDTGRLALAAPPLR